MPPKAIAMIGRRFGKLEVVAAAGATPRGRRLWKCRCACGRDAIVSGTKLRTAETRSCGCLTVEAHRTHGFSSRNEPRSRVYAIWCSMRSRCLNPRHKDYANYGGRGIVICDRWLEGFAQFLADMGEPPTAKHSLERIDNDGPYAPENCRWATQGEQTLNTRRNRVLHFRGEAAPLAEWARRLNLRPASISSRLALGWPVELALSTPTQGTHEPTILDDFFRGLALGGMQP